MVCTVIDHRNDIRQDVQIYKPWKIVVDLISRIFGNVTINQKLHTFDWKEAKKQSSLASYKPENHTTKLRRRKENL